MRVTCTADKCVFLAVKRSEAAPKTMELAMEGNKHPAQVEEFLAYSPLVCDETAENKVHLL